MNKKLFALIALAMLVILPAIVSAEEFTFENATSSRPVTETAYPETIWYLLFLVGAIMLLLIIKYVTSPSPPPGGIMLVSIIGFSMELICAYMAPLVGKMQWLSSGTSAQFVTTYVFSPAVTYICQFLAALFFLMLWYGFILHLRVVRDYKHRVEQEGEERYFEGIWDTRY